MIKGGKGGKGGSVYIMTNANKTVVYVGVTSDLVTRIIEHREKLYPRSFTARYNLVQLVYYENFSSIEEAIAREKQLKAGSRKRKDDLITAFNPDWNDLYEVIKDW